MYRVSNIKVRVVDDNSDNLINKICKKMNVNKNDIINYKIIKKSLDARGELLYLYVLLVELNKKIKLTEDIVEQEEDFYKFPSLGNKELESRVIVVGAGPSGLFVSYFLAKYGYKPIIIERGERVEERVKKVEEFFACNKLDVNSNVQFGEGGAGTFSDGKLNSAIKDKNNRIKEVLKIFVECGAPSEILYVNKPHIGTDLLRKVIINMREKIINMGGEFRYNNKLEDIIVKDNKLESIIVNGKKILCSHLFLCIGHSARDTFRMLHKKVLMHNKPFAVGVRISHSQEIINVSQYGNGYPKSLGAASYKLTYNTKEGRGVYSFCMCPGGYVVNSSSEENRLVVNGMSNYARDTKTANSALIVTVNSSDYGDGILDGIKFQEKLEEEAYKLGNGLIPAQKYGDFLNNIKSTSIGIRNTKGNITLSNIREILPKFITDSLIEAIDKFNLKIPGYSSKDAVIYAIESRTSSPVRILRNDSYESSVIGVYPVGEGAGYAGGITSSAVDGIKAAEIFAQIYKA